MTHASYLHRGPSLMAAEPTLARPPARPAVACALALAFAGPVSAQRGNFLEDKISEQAKEKAGRAVG